MKTFIKSARIILLTIITSGCISNNYNPANDDFSNTSDPVLNDIYKIARVRIDNKLTNFEKSQTPEFESFYGKEIEFKAPVENVHSDGEVKINLPHWAGSEASRQLGQFHIAIGLLYMKDINSVRGIRKDQIISFKGIIKEIIYRSSSDGYCIFIRIKDGVIL